MTLDILESMYNKAHYSLHTVSRGSWDLWTPLLDHVHAEGNESIEKDKFLLCRTRPRGSPYNS